jgi:hypothetical protein
LGLQEAAGRAHRSQHTILKRKRAAAFVASALAQMHGRHQLGRRRLRLVRRTRFNSTVDMMRAWVLNAPAMRTVVRALALLNPLFCPPPQPLAALVQGVTDVSCGAWILQAPPHHPTRMPSWPMAKVTNEQFRAMLPKERPKLEQVLGHLKWWTNEPTKRRIERALAILEPVALFARAVARQDFCAVYPAWLRTREAVRRAVRMQDFRDTPRGDTDRTKGERYAKVCQALNARGKMLLLPEHLAAYAFDARAHSLPLDASVNEGLGFDLAAARQEALAQTCTVFLVEFFGDEYERECALDDFKEFCATTGRFAQALCPEGLPLGAFSPERNWLLGSAREDPGRPFWQLRRV